MLLSINWLNDFISADIPVKDIADRLTMSGIEVEEIIEVGSQWNNIVVGEIMEISPHPNADKLSLTKVNTGGDIYSVVCGAPNISEGLKVPLALEGALLPNGIKIKRSKIRGEFSEGMICSETELDIGHNGNGIMSLQPDSKPGMPIAESLNLLDTILNICVTPNRPDCLSVIGLAREIAAIFKLPLLVPEIAVSETDRPIEDLISVEIEAPDLCPRYTARLVTDIIIRQSPLWMKRRLENCGIRSINNIVDITNYVLLEWGQPLHAFDSEMIKGNKIIVRKAKKAEKFITLDETERQLPENVLMICDGKRPVAIGGIMGGLNSGVSPKTSSVLLESAYFTPSSIAGSSKALKFKTESSQRFEKGVDINGVIPALNKAASLISQLSEGKVAKGFLDIFPNPPSESKPIMLSVTKINKTIGLELSKKEIKSILERLHIQIKEENSDTLHAVPPSFRYDICEPIDFIEEVVRIKGYEHIPVTYPKAALFSKPANKSLLLSSMIREIMISQGFYEVINYSFFSPSLLKYLNLAETDKRSNPVNILNPLSSSQSVMRTTILPSLLMNLKENQNNKIKTVKIFEISNVFFPKADGKPPVEIKKVSGLVSGLRYGEMWNLEQNEVDFYDIKGSIETLLKRLHISFYRFENDGREPYLHPKKMVSLFINDDYIGSIGEIHPDVLENFEIEGNACIFDLDFDLLASYYSEDVMFRPFSRHPAIYRDIALIIDENISAEKAYETIKSFKDKLICKISIFDCYFGKNIPSGKKSLGYRIKFQSTDRTLTDNEVNKIRDKLLSYLYSEIGAELRD